MTLDKLPDSVAEVTRGMGRTDPFLAFMMIIGALLCGWYVYQQQVMNDRIIALQVDTNSDRRDKTSAILKMVESQENAITLSKDANRLNQAAAHNIANLVKAIEQGHKLEELRADQTLLILQEANNRAESVVEAVDDLKHAVMEIQQND